MRLKSERLASRCRTAGIVVVVVIATGAMRSSAIPARGAVSPALPVLRVETFDFAIRAPATAPAGYVRIRLVNHGPSVHHLVFTSVPANVTMAQVYAIMAGTGPAPAIGLADVGGPNMTAPGDSSETIIELKPGSYAVSCYVTAADGKPHVMKGMRTVIDVKPATGVAAPRPRADLELHARDYNLAFNHSPAPGLHLVHFTTSGPSDHDVQIVRLAAGKSVSDVRKWSAAGSIGEPGVGKLLGGSGGIDIGHESWFSLDLVPGRYAMFCFVPDSSNKPHLMRGMIADFTVR